MVQEFYNEEFVYLVCDEMFSKMQSVVRICRKTKKFSGPRYTQDADYIERLEQAENIWKD